MLDDQFLEMASALGWASLAEIFREDLEDFA
jgi:hypothetical protein